MSETRSNVIALRPNSVISVPAVAFDEAVEAAAIYNCVGNVNVEAFSWALPIVASPVAGIAEIVEDGRTGRLVPPRDPSAFAGAVIELLGDPARSRALGAAGRKIVLECFHPSALLDQLEAAYRRTLRS